MSITPDKAPESLLASDPNALFLQRTDEINELLDSGASLSGHERNCFFLNTGDGHFATASATSGFDFYDDARAVAKCDWDQDGDLDLFFANRTAPRLRFLKNTASNAGNKLSVRLVGTTSNRDAIGARIILHSGDRKILRGLRAGEGFLGQSSKWLHFGLGESETIDSIDVHWPGGSMETFNDLKPNTRIILQQGNKLAKITPKNQRAINLPEKEFQLPTPTSRAAVRLCSRLPVPKLSTITPSGKTELITPQNQRPIFLTLWASWCPACDSEFKDLASHAEQLKQAGIDTLAVSVNGLGEGDDTTFSDAQKYLSDLGLEATLRQATPDLLQQLQIIANQIVAQNDPLPLPSGFLIDPSGKIAAFYRGPAPIDHLLETVSQLSPTDSQSIFTSALPYQGSWIGEPRAHSLPRLINEFIDAGFIDEALSFARDHQANYDSKLAFAETFSNAGNQFADKEDFTTAVSYYLEALAIHEQAPRVHFNLALAYERQGKIQEALTGYKRSVELDPKITVSHLNRGAILIRNPKTLSEGLASLQIAARLNPNLAATHYHLGMALERTGKFPEAYQSYRKANLLAPDHYGNAMQMAHLLERSGQIEQALAEYQKIARIHPRNPQIPFQSGMACERLKQIKLAISHYRKSLAISPNYLPALNNLAYLLVTSPEFKDPPRALKLAMQAVSLTQAKNPAVLDTLASAQIANYQQAEALKSLEKALSLAKASGLQTMKNELNNKISKLKNSK